MATLNSFLALLSERETMSDTDHEIINKKLDAILTILNGNGKIGLCAKVNILWSIGMFLIVSVSGLLIKAFMGL